MPKFDHDAKAARSMALASILLQISPGSPLEGRKSNMKNTGLFSAIIVALALTVGAGTANNGTFKFLTQSLPDGTTNGEYAARFITVNADGPVTFATLSALPAGLA